MKKLLGAIGLLLACASLHADVNDWSRDEFQFTFAFTNPLTTGTRKSSPHSTVYLYVPARARHVRALLLLQQNVVEQKVSVHPAIRRVCDADGIAIAWCSPGFDLVFTDHPDQLHQLIQDQFGRFGATIGYPELGRVPLIAFGHSNTTAYAQNGAEARPDRVLAAIVTHGWNGVDHFNRYHGPALVFIGSYWEFHQGQSDLLENRGMAASLGEAEKRLKRAWLPLSIVEEYGSGHFDYSEPVMDFLALYIDKAVRARLAPDGSLRELDPRSGWIAEIPEVPAGPIAIKAYAAASPAERSRGLWYFDRRTAEAAAKIIEGQGSWNRAPQLIGYRRGDGSWAPFKKGGLVDPVPYRIDPGTNRIHFWPALREALPADFRRGGHPLEAPADLAVTMEYDCGPYLYRDAAGDYRVKLNRNGFSGYLVARSAGDAQVRPAVQATRLMLGERGTALVGARGESSEDGAALTWAVGPAPLNNPGNQVCGADVSLPASAPAGEFLGYYIDHGPARIVDGRLKILDLPAQTRGPLEVELVGYLLDQAVRGRSSVRFQVSR